MSFAIFFPGQLQRQVAMGLQLPPDHVKIGCRRLAPSGSREGRAKHDFFHAPLIPVRRERPTHPGGGGCFQILVDSALGDQTTARNLLLFEPQRIESENFF